MARKGVNVSVYLKPEVVEDVNRLAELAGMSRSQFVETLIEITVDSEGPLIDFSLRLGRVAKRLWPRKARTL